MTPSQIANPESTRDDEYFEILAQALRVCAQYRPMFGKGRRGGLSLMQFQQMYGADPFYSWLGLDSPMVYAAHKAAGGMTSIYRQIGMGGQWVFSKVLQDTLGLSAEEANWSYPVPAPDGGTRTLSLDGRIALSDVGNPEAMGRVREWLDAALRRVAVDPMSSNAPRKGVVFEVRQGYKSKDSKRQNADIANAAHAYVEGYMPAVVLLSTQIDGDIAVRYTQARWLILRGSTAGSATESTYEFCREVLGYDLAGFFQRNSGRFKAELERVLEALLRPNGS